jgi:phosphatidate cytidylyltransferase
MAASELTRRVGVAVVGIPAVVLILYLGGWVMSVPIALLGAVGAGEVYDLAEARDTRPLRWLGMSAVAGLVFGAAALPSFGALAPWGFAGLGAVAGAALILAMPLRGVGQHPLNAVSVTLFGVVYVGTPLMFVMLMHSLPAHYDWGGPTPSSWTGALLVLLPLAVTWVGDSAAFFLGTAFGKSKIAPSISPNKSWVGALAGAVGSGLAAVVWLLVAEGLLPGLPVQSLWVAALLGVLIGVGGQVGAFLESLLKRDAGVKDSGSLFPGHGGVLDRLDALVLAFPLCYACLVVAEALG